MIIGCERRAKRPNLATRRAIDTASSRQILEVRPELDSLCGLRTDSLVDVYMDSIIERRQLELQKMVGK